jgi:hypothetical protein
MNHAMKISTHWLSAALAAIAASALTGCPTGPIDVTLAKPAQGYQFAIQPFEVPKGTETQRCFFMEVPSDEPVFVNKFEIAQNTGTHHMNVFRVKTIKGLGGVNGESVVDGECWISPNWSDWPLVVNSQESNSGTPNPNDPGQNGYTSWQLPDGVAMRFEPRELLMFQSHYVNATTQETPHTAKVFVNFHTIAATNVTAEVGTAFATNQSIKVCPGDTGKYFETSCRISQDQNVTIIAANSHFHSRGTRFTISPFDPASTTDAAPFYESLQWADPPMRWDLNVPVPVGGGFKYRCEYSVPADDCGDPTKDCCYTFGGKVETQEHCNAFVYFYPKTRDVGCF